jgi:GNAT superfamily N-acetyltransferase
MGGHVELSTMDVHPNTRGRGFGAALTAALAWTAIAQGDVLFLRVFSNNPAASLYVRLGFRERRRLWVLQWRRPTPAETERAQELRDPCDRCPDRGQRTGRWSGPPRRAEGEVN